MIKILRCFYFNIHFVGKIKNKTLSLNNLTSNFLLIKKTFKQENKRL